MPSIRWNWAPGIADVECRAAPEPEPTTLNRTTQTQAAAATSVLRRLQPTGR